MKQLFITGYGKIEDNILLQDHSKPNVGVNEVLIEINSAGVNPIDYKIIQGILKRIKKLSFPAPIGFDVSGIVVEKGEDVTGFEIGDEIYSRVPTDKPGTFAEYIAIDSNVVAKKPANISFEKASGIPLVGLTTIQGFALATIKKGDKVLIHAGSGGIGSFAIQYAKSKGAFVYTTTSTKNIHWVKELGADLVIDYKKENYLNIVKDVDIVLDTLGSNYTKDAFRVIKNGGKVITLIGDIDNETAKELGLNSFIRFLLSIKRMKIDKLKKQKSALYRFIIVEPNAFHLDEITSLIEKEDIKPIIDRVFSLEKSIDALLYLKEGHAKGKVIIRMKS